ncbi:hypothetical protein [Krasilnikovia sp. MM14-A1004]|uniref:hypothetical protein n=1 Tax=Krasilnikovia sp. MM14-A1004 TaxID=3373541 RepID=UPI00399C9980
MAQTVIHQPRVAWEGAQAFVRAAGGPEYSTFAGRVVSRLGDDLYGELADTRERLLTAAATSGGDRRAADIELGRWRVRLEDLLRTHPELAGAVQDLSAESY